MQDNSAKTIKNSQKGETMKKGVLWGIGLLFLTVPSSLFGQWATVIGGGGHERARSVCQTRKGDFMVVGQFSLRYYNQVEPPPSYSWSDIFLWKLSNTGKLAWAKTYGGNGDDLANAMQETSDGGFIVAGQTSSFGNGGYDFWVLKLTSGGGIKWQKTYGGNQDDFAHAVQETIDGGYIVAGTTSSFGKGGSDIWILKLDFQGEVEWQKTYGDSKDDGAKSLQKTLDGGYVVAGYTSSEGKASWSMWVLKLTPKGEVEWQCAYTGSNHDFACSVQETRDGGFIVAGSTSSYGAGYQDCWVLKLWDNGKIEWQKTFGGADDDWPFIIRQDKDFGYIIGGTSNSFGIGNNGYDSYGEFLIFKLRSDGSIKWQKTYGGNYSWDVGCFIAPTAEGGYIAAGGTCSWGVGGEDIFILNLLSNGNITSACPFVRKITLTVTDTTASPHKTRVEPQKSKGSVQDTTVVPQVNSQEQLFLGTATCELKMGKSSGGTTEPSAGTHTYDTGARVTLKATPEESYYFNIWRGHIFSRSREVEITMDGNKSIAANFYHISGGDWGYGGDYGGNKSRCFIATAAYGFPGHPHVRILRTFRDQYLLTTRTGRKLVKAYYQWSPGVASFISQHRLSRIIARIGLLPFVGLSWLLIYCGPTGTGIAVLLIFCFPLVFFWRRKNPSSAIPRHP